MRTHASQLVSCSGCAQVSLCMFFVGVRFLIQWLLELPFFKHVPGVASGLGLSDKGLAHKGAEVSLFEIFVWTVCSALRSSSTTSWGVGPKPDRAANLNLEGLTTIRTNSRMSTI